MPPLKIESPLRRRHTEAFESARHVFSLESRGQIATKAILVIVAVFFIWYASGSNEAISELIAKIAGTAALILIFPIVYLWHFLRVAEFAGKRPRMLIAIGLIGLVASLAVISVGVVFYWKNTLADVSKEIAVLRGDISNLRQSPTVPSGRTAAPEQKKLNEKQIRELLDALKDASDLVEKKILPTSISIEVTVANSFHSLREDGATKRYAAALREGRARLKTDVWDQIDDFVYKKHADYRDQFRLVFDLDNEVAKGALNRLMILYAEDLESLQNQPTESMIGLVKQRFEDTRRESNRAYNWVVQIKNRIASVTTNLNSNGVTGLEK